MSSNRRPWYPWYPKDFVVDEKVQGLSDDAELLYRRVLDVLWQANALQLPNNCLKLANQIARGWSKERFENAWNEMQHPGFELLKETDCGNFVYSPRLAREAQKIEKISKTRSKAAKAKQKHSTSKAYDMHRQCHPDTYTDTHIKKSNKKKKISPPTLREAITYFTENGFTEASATKAWNYYNDGNPPWHDSKGKPVLSWKQKMRGVWFKEENKIQTAHCGYREINDKERGLPGA